MNTNKILAVALLLLLQPLQQGAVAARAEVAAGAETEAAAEPEVAAAGVGSDDAAGAEPEVTAAAGIIPVRRAARMEVGTLPLSVDNSLLPYFPPLINQVGGSCAQASYIGYMYTYEMCRLMGWTASESSQYRFSYLYTWNFINDGTDMGSYGYDGLRIAMSNGVMTEADYPKTTSVYSYYWASGYDKYYRAMANRLNSFVLMPATTADELEQIKRYLYDHGQEGSGSGGLVTFSSKASNWKMNNSYDGPSETGYHCMLTALATEGGHAMTIVGYDDLVQFQAPDGSTSQGAFIVTNSWGSWSHDNGRYYLPYWFFLNRENISTSDLSSDVCAVEVERRSPQLTFRVGIDCDARNNLSFSMGASPIKSPYSTVEYKVSIADYQGGGHKMCGQYASSEIEMGFDFSNAVRFIEDLGDLSFYLTVNRNSKDGHTATKALLKRFDVLDYRDNSSNPKVYSYNIPKGGEVISSGRNVFRLDTVDPPTISRNGIEWIGRSGKPVTSPLVFRTADGKYAKVRVLQYDREAGTMTIKYVYSPSGDRNVKQ